MFTGGLLLSLCVAACGASPKVETAVAPAQLGAPTIHTVTASPAGILVNAYLVEGPRGVVAVDSALTVSDAEALVAKLNAIGKPLLAVLITHGHPDHYNGVTALLQGRPAVPVYATAAVAAVIRESDAAKEAQWKPMFGAQWPSPRTFPNHIVHDGESVELDGFSYWVHDVGPGESHADSYWQLQAHPSSVFLGDVVLHGEHAYVSDGHTGAWLATLDRLREQLRDVQTFYPGHGSSGGRELFDWEAGYLRAYRGEVEQLRAGGEQLSDAAKQELVTRMKARYPAAGIEFLIPLGADPVARELAAEAKRAGQAH